MRSARYLLFLFVVAFSLSWSVDGFAQQKKKKKKKSETAAETDAAKNGSDDDDGSDGEEEAATDPGTSLQRGSRMEFDGRLIRGEHAGSGAVFLFERVPRHLPSMIDKRKTYLRETVRRVLGPAHTVSFDEARRKAVDLEERKNARDASEGSDD